MSDERKQEERISWHDLGPYIEHMRAERERYERTVRSAAGWAGLLLAAGLLSILIAEACIR